LSVTRNKRRLPAQEIEKLDKQYLWHPFTQMSDWEKEPQIVIESGKGNILTDIRGKKYIDGVSSLWVTVHGHRKKEIDAAVSAQLKKISHSTLLGLSNVPAVLLAEKLVQIAPPGLSKVFYSDSGSTAVEIALKIAFQYWQQKGQEYRGKTGFISLREAYHGDTIGSVSVGGIDLFHEIYKPLLFHSYKIDTPHCYRCALRKTYPACNLACAKQAEEVFRSHNQEAAALIIEPLVQGAAGMLVSPPGYLRRIRKLCTKYNILMIVDEVATGFGRTGKMFACEHEGVSPDIMCVAKGITGGYLPLAATLTTGEIFSGFLGEYRELRTFFHGHTYTGNPLACAAAIANIDLFKKEKTLRKLESKISFLLEQLVRFKQLKHVGDIRQKGFMVGVELVKNRETKEPYPLEDKMGIRVILECRKRGLIIRPLGNVIVLMPPLSISMRELRRMMEIVYTAIKKITGGS
jgi:adenosylmethionine-8-amino-7-oxononanoate aminotransferase